MEIINLYTHIRRDPGLSHIGTYFKITSALPYQCVRNSCIVIVIKWNTRKTSISRSGTLNILHFPCISPGFAGWNFLLAQYEYFGRLFTM